jgi:aminoglycoside 6'-N-acetyltransferase I
MASGTRYGVDIRGAVPADAPDMALLLRQLGYEVDAREAAERLERIGRDPDGTLLVATGYDGAVIGLVAVHWCTMMQQARPVARITTMVVDDRERRRGIGRILMKAAAQAARAAGCDVLELTTALHRAEAQSFYQSIGFTLTAQRFSRSLRKNKA